MIEIDTPQNITFKNNTLSLYQTSPKAMVLFYPSSTPNCLQTNKQTETFSFNSITIPVTPGAITAYYVIGAPTPGIPLSIYVHDNIFHDINDNGGNSLYTYIIVNIFCGPTYVYNNIYTNLSIGLLGTDITFNPSDYYFNNTFSNLFIR